MNGSGRSVLVIDDEDMVRKAICRTLVRGGYRVRDAAGGAAGIASLGREPADLVLTDMRMPDVSGIEVARRIRTNPATAATPVVFLTGFGDTESCVAGFEAGAVDFVRKPFSSAELLARVAAAIRGGASAARSGDERAARAGDAPPRVLLVEDDEAQAQSLARLLAQRGIEVRHERTAEGFLRAIREEDPDAVILDLLLPDGRGIDLVAQVRGHARLRGVPVLIASGLDSTQDRVAGLEAGADDYLAKPLVAAEFSARVQAATRRGREERRRRNETAALAEGAARDPKTGLAHHGTLTRRLVEEIARVRRVSRPLSLLLLDLDHFKNWNDTYGHLAGDELLKNFAGLLSEGRRATDLPARFGGEEFVLLLPDSPAEEAARIAEEIRARTARRLEVTVSIGGAEFTEGDRSPEDLLGRADRALYRAKAEGRDRVRMDPPGAMRGGALVANM